MTLSILRALFVLLMGSVGFYYLNRPTGPFGESNWATLSVAVAVALLVLAVDIFSSRRKLLGLSSLLFGMLVGLLLGWALGLAVEWLVTEYIRIDGEVRADLIQFLKLMLNVVCCYLVISFIFQTKDDIRFIIPYVEFARQARGPRPLLLDSSALIDGRILDISEVGMIDSRLVIPRFVLDELQKLADSSDRLRRNRGRRGLDMVSRLQGARKVEVVIYEGRPQHASELGVDQQLVALAGEMDGRVLTTDFNLNKVAQLRGVGVVNINDLATAMKPIVLPGEHVMVEVIKPGEQPGQAVGYLDDGTMVVVEHARQCIGEGELETTVTSIVQTSAGRMIFARLDSGGRRRSAEEVPAESPKS